MTPDQIKALPVGSVVLDHRGCAWQKHPDGGWVARFDDHTTGALADDERLVLIHDPSAAPEPDHSMCARHDPSLRRAVQEAIGEASVCWDNVSGAGVFDVARANAVADRLCAILDIPEPEPTVVERAAAEIQRADERGDDSYKAMAQALADAGLLVRDGEQ